MTVGKLAMKTEMKKSIGKIILFIAFEFGIDANIIALLLWGCLFAHTELNVASCNSLFTRLLSNASFWLCNITKCAPKPDGDINYFRFIFVHCLANLVASASCR